MPRALKNLDITLGLAVIPVQLFTATSSQGVAFHLLHAKCGSRIQMRLECPIHGIVPREETVKGYETAKDEYVRFEPEELKALEQASSSALVIDSFVPEGAIDPVYFEDTYYLGAGKNGERGYRVLTEALEKTKRIAVGTFTWRGKTTPIAIRRHQEGGESRRGIEPVKVRVPSISQSQLRRNCATLMGQEAIVTETRVRIPFGSRTRDPAARRGRARSARTRVSFHGTLRTVAATDRPLPARLGSCRCGHAGAALTRLGPLDQNSDHVARSARTDHARPTRGGVAMSRLDRRTFLKGTGMLGASTAVAGVGVRPARAADKPINFADGSSSPTPSRTTSTSSTRSTAAR